MNRVERYIETKTSHILNALETNKIEESKIVFLQGIYGTGKTTILNKLKKLANKELLGKKVSFTKRPLFHSGRVVVYQINRKINDNTEMLIEAILIDLDESQNDFEEDITWLVDIADRMGVSLLIASSMSRFKSIIGKKRVKCFSVSLVNEKNRVKPKENSSIGSDKKTLELLSTIEDLKATNKSLKESLSNAHIEIVALNKEKENLEDSLKDKLSNARSEIDALYNKNHKLEATLADLAELVLKANKSI